MRQQPAEQRAICRCCCRCRCRCILTIQGKQPSQDGSLPLCLTGSPLGGVQDVQAAVDGAAQGRLEEEGRVGEQ